MKWMILIFLLLFQTTTWSQSPNETPPSTPAPPSEEAFKSPWRFVLGLGYSLQSKASFKNGINKTPTDNTTFETDLTYKNSFTILGEIQNMPAESWGFTAGLQIDGEREVSDTTIRSSGGSSSSSNSDSKLSVFSAHANAVYRWQKFYIPFGVNFSGVKFSPSSAYTGSTDAEGGIGSQFGMGWFFSETAAAEIAARALAVRIKGQAGNVETDYGTGYLTTISLLVKFGL